MKVYYKNHHGQIVDFTTMPYIVTEADLFDYEWKYENTNSLNPKISIFYKQLTKKNLKIALAARSQDEYKGAWAYLLEVTEKDVLAKLPGMLFVGDEYLLCYITGCKKTKWHPGVSFMVNDLTVTSETGTWIRESQFSFLARSEITTDTQDTYMDYPYDHAYDYSSAILAYDVINKGFSGADFELTIAGPCSYPEVTVAGHLYQVDAELEAGELLKVNSMTRKIYKIKVNGEQVNQFHLRNREYYIFRKIPEGNNVVTWDGSFSFWLTLYEGRSEPRWT